MSAFLTVRKTVKQAFAFALCSGFPSRMSLPLGPTDIFSAGCRPSQTARQLLSSFKLATSQTISSITLLLSFGQSLTSTLLPILCTIRKVATTSCSKGLQGLRFPLGVFRIFTENRVQKVLVRDSDNLVKPFMQAAIQTARYYAHYVTSFKIN